MATDTALRITCSKSDLAAALGVVARAVSTRGAVQVLGGILLRAEEGRLTLSATDMEISLRSSLGGEIAGDASVVVPGRLLTDLVRLLPEDTVTLVHEEGDGVLSVTSGSHTSRLNVYSAEDFPRLPPLDVQLHQHRGGGSPRDDRQGGRAASRDESRPVLTGILVRFEGDRLVMAATDSYRLAVKETALSAGGRSRGDHPGAGTSGARPIAAGSDDVELGVHENHVIFSGRRRLARRANISTGSSRTTSSFCPRPSRSRSRLRGHRSSRWFAARGSWRSGTLRCVCASPKASSRFRLRRKSRRSRRVDPVEFSGEELEIGFNPEFLRDGLEAVRGDTVHLKLINRLRPGLIAAPEESFWYLIMPIRLAG